MELLQNIGLQILPQVTLGTSIAQHLSACTFCQHAQSSLSWTRVTQSLCNACNRCTRLGCLLRRMHLSSSISSISSTRHSMNRSSVQTKHYLRHACALISSRAVAKEAMLAPLLMTPLSFRLTILQGVTLTRYQMLCMHNLCIAQDCYQDQGSRHAAAELTLQPY